MVTGDAINYYANNVDGSAAVIKLKEWYNSDDKKSHILSKSQFIS